MKNNVVFLNSSFAALSQIIIFLVGMILPKIFLNTYGSEVNGMVTSIYQFISYITLLEAGLGAAAIFSLYRPIANNDFSSINMLMTSVKKNYQKLSFYFLLCLIILSFIYPYILHSSSMTYFEIVILVIVLGFGSIIEFWTMAKYRVFLTADQKIYIISIANIIGTVSNFIITIVLCYFYYNVVLVKFIALASFFLRTYFVQLYIKKNYSFLNLNLNSIEPLIIPNKGNALFVQLFSIISLSIPIIIVTLTGSLVDVSVFSIYNMVCIGAISIISIFSTGISAIFGRYYVNKDFTELKNQYNKFEFNIMLILSIVIGGLLSLLYSFVSIYTFNIDDANYTIYSYSILFPIWTLSHVIRIPQDTLVTASGKFKEIKMLNFIQTILFLIFPLIASLLWGINGILIVMILINFARYYFLTIFVEKYVMSLDKKRILTRFITLILSITFIYLFSFFIETNEIQNFYTWIVHGVLIFLFSLLTTSILFLISDKNQFKQILKSLNINFFKR